MIDPAVWQVLTHWQRNTGRRLELSPRGPLTGGASGAVLVPITIEESGRVTGAIMKVCPAELDGPAREPGNHVRALRVSPPEFASAHLVGQLFDPIALPDGGSVMFQQVAADSLDKLVTLAAATGHANLGYACENVSAAVLGSWNPGGRGQPGPSIRGLTVGEYLTELLDYRLHPGHRLLEWMDRNPSISKPRGIYMPAGVAGGSINPFALMSEPRLATMPASMTLGAAHGDLHVDNVLVESTLSTGDLDRFRLVDLSTFKENAPLARDPHHLLLSVAHRYLPLLGYPARRLLVNVLTGAVSARPKQLPLELVAAADGVRTAGRQWFEQQRRGHEWRDEELLSLIGCAIMFVGRYAAAEPEISGWFLDLAAQAATVFVGEVTSTRTTPPRLTPPQPRSAPSSDPKAARPVRRTSRDWAAIADATLRVPNLRSTEAIRQLITDLPDPVSNYVDQSGGPKQILLRLLPKLDEFAYLGTWSTYIASVVALCGDEEHPELAGLRQLLRWTGAV